jgi:hypothetical protein
MNGFNFRDITPFIIFSACCLIHTDFLLDLFFTPQDAGDMFLRKVDRLSQGNRVVYSRRYNSSIIEVLLSPPSHVRST